jgi:pSer/pThr/pTyr-binding forkhead associated (FHA) protein
MSIAIKTLEKGPDHLYCHPNATLQDFVTLSPAAIGGEFTMKSIPTIVVQIVHIQGPLKGEIQEFTDPEIAIGRNPSCQVHFPGDLNVVSRLHAEIVREGNRFKLIDRSSNGTFVNGKEVTEQFLKNGDVMMFAEDGPKASFLSEVKNIPQEETAPAPPAAVPEPPKRPVSVPPTTSGLEDLAVTPGPEPLIEKGPPSQTPAGQVKMPLVIQYGPRLHSFDELPVTIGAGPGSDYVLDFPGILSQHAEIFYQQGAYWVRDLTGQQRVQVNGVPVQDQARLAQECRLWLTPEGPKFQFIGGGRLLEIEDPLPETPPDPPPAPHDPPPLDRPKEKGPVSALKKLWKK